MRRSSGCGFRGLGRATRLPQPRARGIGVAPASAFAIDLNLPKPDGVRIGLTVIEKDVDVPSALSTLATLLGEDGARSESLAA